MVGRKERCVLNDDKVVEVYFECDGDNDFKIPHLKKAAARKKGAEVSRVFCTPGIVSKAEKFVMTAQQ